MKRIKPKELTSLARFIDAMYSGDPSAVSRDFTKIIYMLHYIPQEEFTRQEIQQMSYLLHEIGECFYKINDKRKSSSKATLSAGRLRRPGKR
jgi:hypothetical protein